LKAKVEKLYLVKFDWNLNLTVVVVVVEEESSALFFRVANCISLNAKIKIICWLN
jgi:hypothetical protein